MFFFLEIKKRKKSSIMFSIIVIFNMVIGIELLILILIYLVKKFRYNILFNFYFWKIMSLLVICDLCVVEFYE